MARLERKSAQRNVNHIWMCHTAWFVFQPNIWSPRTNLDAEKQVAAGRK